MVTLELITPHNVSLFKAVRLRALLDTPTAFASTYAGESQLSDAEWLSRAARCLGEDCVGYLAMEGEIVCGIVRGTPDDQEAGVIWLESMWVAPSHRRRGVGRLLVDGVLAWARQRRAAAVKLSVTSNNDSALRFYERLGFSLTGRTEPYPNDAGLAENEMIRSLTIS